MLHTGAYNAVTAVSQVTTAASCVLNSLCPKIRDIQPRTDRITLCFVRHVTRTLLYIDTWYLYLQLLKSGNIWFIALQKNIQSERNKETTDIQGKRENIEVHINLLLILHIHDAQTSNNILASTVQCRIEQVAELIISTLKFWRPFFSHHPLSSYRVFLSWRPCSLLSLPVPACRVRWPPALQEKMQ